MNEKVSPSLVHSYPSNHEESYYGTVPPGKSILWAILGSLAVFLRKMLPPCCNAPPPPFPQMVSPFHLKSKGKSRHSACGFSAVLVVVQQRQSHLSQELQL